MLIRYYSHAGLQTGYGRAATELALALAKHPEIELELVPIPVKDPTWIDAWVKTTLSTKIAALEPYLRKTSFLHGELHWPEAKTPDVVIVHTQPGDCGTVLELEGLTDHPCTVAYTTYEGMFLPELAHRSLDHFHQVWIPSTACGAGAWATSAHEVRTLPHVADPDHALFRRQTPDGGRYRFYWIGAWAPRKNPEGLLRAFVRAFAPTDDVELVIRSEVDHQTYYEALVATGVDQAALPHITLMRDPLSPAQIWQMHADHDCYVTATHGECWDLGAFEAYLMGRAIITPFTGSHAYLTTGGAHFVRAHPAPAHGWAKATPVPGGYHMALSWTPGMDCRDTWLEPDLLELATILRAVWDARERTHPPFAPERFSRAAVAAAAVTYCKELLR